MVFSSYISWDDLKVEGENLQPQNATDTKRVIVVDQTGKGDCLTVQAAVDLVPHHNPHRLKIYILPGLYREKVNVPASKPYVSFIGDPERAEATVIAWHNRASDLDENGDEIGTFRSASVTVEADYFCGVGITFQNTVQFSAGARGNQAVALRISGDHSVLYKSRFLGSQDTLLDESGTHFFYKCLVQGSIDFIFGSARSLYMECTISVIGESFAIAAQRRDTANDDGVFSFVNCTIHGGGGGGGVFLGRAWGDYSRVVYSYSELDIDVKPQGWDDWGKPSRQKTVLFGEYKCRGKGADRRGRAAWSKALTHHEAQPYLDLTFIAANQWLRL
ncbi:pectinesterase QRT1-like [Salvia splendens]|uniref:pectinesterase QRT1-like n=1 Tax=Salvia splendens TaxID=180675 RepID=UPI001C271FD0|nr:pectinesterase QRT1-like [Salvia splendens]